jgi:tRNA pseudouridine13 synthase
MDIHPTGSLWGDKAPLGAGTVAELENSIAGANSELCEGLIKARVEAASRPLRLRVQDLEWEVGDDVVWLEFALGRGGYATSVLREIVSW